MIAIEIGTSQSATQSEVNSMDSLQMAPATPVLKLDKRRIPTFSIQGTQCCGFHSVSGFQYTTDPDCEAFFLGIEKSYQYAKQMNVTGSQQNRDSENRFYHLSDEQREGIQFGYPYPNIGPERIAGMLVFTWNSASYDPMAKKLAEFVKANGLGSCVLTGKVVNPNSSKHIEAMTWLVDQDGYHKFINARKEYL